MKANLAPVLLALVVLAVAGCAGVDSRVRQHPDFANWPAAVQDKVIQGQVDIGFTREQVYVALGDPDRTFTRTTADGTSEVWTYRDRKPRFSFGVGLGVGSFGRSSATSVGLGLGTSTGYRDDEKMGIVFDRLGRVASIETRGR